MEEITLKDHKKGDLQTKFHFHNSGDQNIWAGCQQH